MGGMISDPVGGMSGLTGGEMSSMTEEGGDSAGTEEETDPTQEEQPFGDEEDTAVLCGEDSCDLTTNTCCISEFGATCVDGVNASCNFGGTPLICDGPEDCRGDQCCLSVGLPGELTCSPRACVNLTLCHQDQDCSEDKICRRCQFTGLSLAVCSRPNILPNLALSCE